MPDLTAISFAFCTLITRRTSGVVHSLAFIGRIRTATVKLLTSLFDLLSSLISVLFRILCGVSQLFLPCCGVCVSISTLLKQSGVETTDTDALRSVVGVELPNSRFAAGFVAEKPLKILLTALDAPFRLLDEALNGAFGVFNLVPFDANLVPPTNGDDENPVLRISSFWFNRNRSRKSHADVCLISVGRGAADNFFVVLNVARAGFTGVVDDGVESFAPFGFVLFTVGVNRDIIAAY